MKMTLRKEITSSKRLMRLTLSANKDLSILSRIMKMALDKVTVIKTKIQIKKK
jgi:hypothetical protein